MKASKYNIYVKKKHGVICFNTFHDIYSFMSAELYELIQAEEYDKISDRQKKYLFKSGFLIEQDDELALLKNEHSKAVGINGTYELTLLPSLDCNLRCWYCFEKHIKNSHLNVITQNLILNYVDSILCRDDIKFLNLELFGGEPLLYFKKELYPLLKQSIGALPTNDLFIKKTQLYPIGTKGLQFIQVKANVPFSSFIQEMLQILIESILLTIIILGYVIFLVITIHKKDKLFKRREASVNGTIHDLKSPLNSIITLMSFIKKKVPDIHTQQLVENTERQAQKLVNEIEALLITARKDRQKVYLQKEETDLVLLVTEVAQEVSMQHSHQPHQIKMESELNELNLMLDPLYVRNVIRNLVENALKYSDDGVQIIIRISKKETQAIFTVKDNGWGIAPKYQKKIFTQFFQVPREQMAHQRGYGIGLAYTKYIIEAHGGSISVESIPGKGSIFICKFPLPS
jgi:signal transduction histidine kinase